MKQTITLLALTCFSLASPAQQASLPYFDDFETGAPGWTPYVIVQSGTNWELGSPTSGFTIGAYSGRNCWDVNLNSPYSNFAVCYLSSPIFDFSYVTHAEISFWTRYQAEYLWDYMAVQYTANKGDTWEFLPFPNLINPDGFVEKWIHSSLSVNDLYGNSSIQFRFVFVSDGSIAFDGYSIDDFRIDIGALGAPESGANNAFSFYPNPSNGSLNFSFPGILNKDALISIYDATGKQIKSYEAATLISAQTDLGLNQGVYSVALENSGSLAVKKLVVVQ
jgi:hypothetical protein